MCGIVGICKKQKLTDKDLSNINNISEKLNHRGPNQKGDWINPEKNIFFSNRRLSINDLTLNGIQPMISQTGRYVIIFNGEIYNFLDLKKNMFQKNIILKVAQILRFYLL